MNLAKWAQAVKERDGWQCKQCGTADNLHAHHVVPVALGGKNTLDNGTTLCQEHHYSLHSEMGALQYRVPTGRFQGIQELIIDSPFTQRQIADALGIHYNTLSNWFHGKSEPGLKKLIILMMTIGVDKEEILDMRLGDLM